MFGSGRINIETRVAIPSPRFFLDHFFFNTPRQTIDLEHSKGK